MPLTFECVLFKFVDEMKKFFVAIIVIELSNFNLVNCKQCYQCDDKTKNCSFLQADDFGKTVCDSEEKGCFVLLDKENHYLVRKRGCVNDQDLCNDLNKENCVVCSDNLCNGEQFAVEKCAGNNDYMECPKTTFDKAGCYLMIDANNTENRGCVANFTQSKLNDCQNDTNCHICHGDYCNRQKGLSCYVCDSRNDVNCKSNLGSIRKIPCKSDLDLCFLAVLDEVVVIRGCLNESKLEKSPFRSLSDMKTCSGNLCNKAKIGEEHFCYICADNSSCFNDQTQLAFNLSIPCDEPVCFSLYVEKWIYGGGDIFIRGCFDRVFGVICNMYRESCRICHGSGCNYELSNDIPRLSCIQCMEHDEKCIMKQFEKPTINFCNIRYESRFENMCFRYTFKKTGLTRYGCLHDHMGFCRNNDCTLCEGPNCNYVIIYNQECLQCNSLDDKNCLNNPGAIESRVCITPQYFGQASCYTRIYDNGVLVRGCVNEMDYKAKRKCLISNYLDCRMCIGNNCNKKLIGRGDEVVTNNTLILISIFIIFCAQL